jgi:hypothetical protein
MEAPWKDHSEKTVAATKRKEEVNKLAIIHEDTENNNHTAKEQIRIGELDNDKEIKELEAKNVGRYSEAYMVELEDIKKKLPDEIKDFADVFCSED